MEGNNQYRTPTVDEIAGFVPHDDMDFNQFRSIKLFNANGTFSCINELNSAYDYTHYVLMFPNGDIGYSYGMPTTVLKFYQQRLQVRENKTLGIFGRLFHEYVIDQYCKIEKYRLDYIKNHQKELRVSSHESTRIEEGVVQRNEGRTYIYLPPSFVSGPRFYHRKYLDVLSTAN